MDRESDEVSKVYGNCGEPGKPGKNVEAYPKSHEKLVKDLQQIVTKIHFKF